MLEKSHFKNKTVLITGNTGFKGSWLCEILNKLGANLIGFSTCKYRNSELYSILSHKKRIKQYIGDVRDLESIKNCINTEKPDFIFHLAAQALVGDSFVNPLETFTINIMGCLNLICALKDYSKECSCVLVTSDKCYKNNEWVYGYREIDNLGGFDPYSASKAAAEVSITGLIESYKDLFAEKSIKISSVRAGNVIGGGDLSKNRLIPDIVKSWLLNNEVNIRNPNSTRPWQHVLDPLRGYLLLAKKMYYENKGCYSSFNFGPNLSSIVDVKFIVDYFSSKLNIKYCIEKNFDEFKESSLLALNCDKAKTELSWEPILNISECLNMTAEWYLTWGKEKAKIVDLTLEQINLILEI